MMPRRIIGKLVHRFTVDEIPGGVSEEPLDLGTLAIKKVEQRWLNKM